MRILRCAAESGCSLTTEPNEVSSNLTLPAQENKYTSCTKHLRTRGNRRTRRAPFPRIQALGFDRHRISIQPIDRHTDRLGLSLRWWLSLLFLEHSRPPFPQHLLRLRLRLLEPLIPPHLLDCIEGQPSDRWSHQD